MHKSHNIQISESNGEEQSLQTVQQKNTVFWQTAEPVKIKNQTNQRNGKAREERVRRKNRNVDYKFDLVVADAKQYYEWVVCRQNFWHLPSLVLPITICHIQSYRIVNVSENFHTDYYDSDMCIVYSVYKGIAGYCRSIFAGYRRNMKHESLDSYFKFSHRNSN